MHLNVGNIVGLIILAIAIAYIGFKYYTILKEDKNKEKVNKVLNSIREVVEEAMIDYLKNIDITNITNINDMQKEILEALYDKIWKLVLDQIAELAEMDETTGDFIKSMLTRKNVEDLVNQIYEKSIVVQEQITCKYNEAVLSASNINEE